MAYEVVSMNQVFKRFTGIQTLNSTDSEYDCYINPLHVVDLNNVSGTTIHLVSTSANGRTIKVKESLDITIRRLSGENV